MVRRNLLLATSLAGAFAGFGQAQAQQAQGGAGASGGTTVGEVVVTAQRRTERLIDVPMNVAVVNAAQMQQRGVIDTADLARTTAGLSMAFFGGYVMPSLRGVSTQLTQSGSASNVAFYLDGVYQVTQINEFLDLPDAKDVEILKGPQGALYGQNAEGGAIVINTLTPTFKPTGRFSLSYGNFNGVRLRGYVSGPLIGDQVAVSLAGSIQRNDGFRTNVFTGARAPGLNENLLRAKVLYQPNDSTSVTLTGFWSLHSDGVSDGVVYKGLSEAALFAPQLIKYSNPLTQTTVQPWVTSDQVVFGASIRGEFNLSVGKIDAMSSFSGNSQHHNTSDLDYSPVNLAWANSLFNSAAYIQDVNFQSKKFYGLTLAAGAYYQNSDDNNGRSYFYLWFPPTIAPAPPTQPPAYFQSLIQKTTRNVYAFYLEGTYDVTPQVQITAGGRYTGDTEHGAFGVDYDYVPPATSPVDHSPHTWTNFSPRVTARYKFTDKQTVYFSWGQGFKSGLLTIQAGSVPLVNPETLTSYEVGYKGVLLGRFSIGVSAFHYDYNNKQVAYYLAPTYVIQNAATARLNGVDLDLDMALTPQFSLTGSAEFLDAQYVKFPGAGTYLPDPLTHGIMNATQNLSGRQLDRAPKWTGTITGDYHVINQYGRFDASASVYYTSRMNWDVNGLIFQDPYATLDAQVSYTPAKYSNLTFVLWGTNLTDTAYLAAYLESAYAAGVSYAPPRQFGGRIEIKF